MLQTDFAEFLVVYFIIALAFSQVMQACACADAFVSQQLMVLIHIETAVQ